jgi:hypothetical protein
VVDTDEILRDRRSAVERSGRDVDVVGAPPGLDPIAVVIGSTARGPASARGTVSVSVGRLVPERSLG